MSLWPSLPAFKKIHANMLILSNVTGGTWRKKKCKKHISLLFAECISNWTKKGKFQIIICVIYAFFEKSNEMKKRKNEKNYFREVSLSITDLLPLNISMVAWSIEELKSRISKTRK